MRFYGTENISLFKAHEKKDLDGILEDGILSSLPESAKAMHDHNIVNYNKQFAFQNIECNIHLERDLQKIADDTGHTVLLSIKELIAQTIHERKKLLEKKKRKRSLGKTTLNTPGSLNVHLWSVLKTFVRIILRGYMTLLCPLQITCLREHFEG